GTLGSLQEAAKADRGRRTVWQRVQNHHVITGPLAHRLSLSEESVPAATPARARQQAGPQNGIALAQHALVFPKSDLVQFQAIFLQGRNPSVKGICGLCIDPKLYPGELL